MSETLLADAPAPTQSPVPPPAAKAPDLAELKRRVAALLPAVREGAEARERDRVLPHEQVRSLVAAGLLTLRIPVRDGGPGGSVRELIELVIDIAASDSNVAQALRPGFLFVEGLLASPDEAVRQRWWPRCLRGDFIANAGWEIGGANGAIATQLRREGDHFRVKGSKYYSTGGLYADWISTVAIDEQGQEVRFVLPRDREGLELLDDFDAMGQRLTASGTTRLNDVQVNAADIVPHPTGGLAQGRRTVVTPLAQLFLGAVLAGIARNALHDAVAFARLHARPIKHSSATPMWSFRWARSRPAPWRPRPWCCVPPSALTPPGPPGWTRTPSCMPRSTWPRPCTWPRSRPSRRPSCCLTWGVLPPPRAGTTWTATGAMPAP